jgi:hypothetical protein
VQISGRRIFMQALVTGAAFGCLVSAVVVLIVGRGQWIGWYLPLGFISEGAVLGALVGMALLVFRIGRRPLRGMVVQVRRRLRAHDR